MGVLGIDTLTERFDRSHASTHCHCHVAFQHGFRREGCDLGCRAVHVSLDQSQLAGGDGYRPKAASGVDGTAQDAGKHLRLNHSVNWGVFVAILHQAVNDPNGHFLHGFLDNLAAADKHGATGSLVEHVQVFSQKLNGRTDQFSLEDSKAHRAMSFE